jgi:asparagine synthase (glutamine-hydrolysing)
MCGIGGLLSAGQTDCVRKMLDRLAHRGPDGRGIWPGAHHTFGHVRLSIIDLEGGAQPMSDRAMRRTITYNGEIYNYQRLWEELGPKGFRTRSDTEVILNLAAAPTPPDVWIRRLDGMFAFAMADGDNIILARDPLGIKPMYVAWDTTAVAFSSEVKAVPGNLRHIAEFPPGHLYSSRFGLTPFYRLPAPTEEITDPSAAEDGLRERLEEAVRKRLIADVPVGVFLSGGLDSSLIAALAGRHKHPLDTFSVGTEDSPDRRRAWEVAAFLGTRHHERVFTIREALKTLPEIIYYLESFDAPLIRSAIPNFFLAKLAADHVKVALAGEGADELFAGYEYLSRFEGASLAHELAHITHALHNTNLQRCDRMSMAHGLEVRVPFLDVAVVDYAFRTALRLKRHPRDGTEKWILRQLGGRLLPAGIARRAKVKFAAGSGLGDHLARFAEKEFTDAEFARRREVGDGIVLRSKEELFYYRIFQSMFPREDLLPLVGRSRSV